MIHIHDVINHRISKLIEYSLALIVSQEPDGNDSLDYSLDRLEHTYIDTGRLPQSRLPLTKKHAEYSMTY
jgi:hypothetical protein